MVWNRVEARKTMPDTADKRNRTPNTSRWALVAAILGGMLVLGGVICMMQPDSAIFPTPPAGFMRDIFPNPISVIDGTFYAVIGLLLIGMFLPDYLEECQRGHTAPASALPHITPGWSRLRVLLSIVSALLYLSCLIGAFAHAAWPVLLLALILALLMLVIAVAARPGTKLPRVACDLSSWDVAFVFGIIAALIAFTLRDLGDWHFTYWGDEWPFYSYGRQVATGWAVDPFSQAGVYGIHPFADSIYQGLVMRAGGLNATAWRFSGILATALPIAPLYILGRMLGGRLYAAAAVIVYACCPLLWSFARIGYNNDDPLFFTILAVVLFLSGIRRQSAARLIAAGLCAGSVWYSIYTGRLIIGVLVAVLITEWHGGWPAWWRRMTYVLAGFAITVAPLIVDNGRNTLGLMSHNTPLSTTHSLSEYLHLVGHNIVRAVYAFVYSTANDHYVYGAIFDPVAAAALLVGVALALRRIHALEARLLLIWYAATLFLTTPFNDADGVSLTRSMVVVPPAALLAASGLCAYWRAMQRLIPVAPKPLLSLGLACSLCASLAFNLHQNYVTMPNNLYPPYPQMVLLVKAIREAPDTTFILPVDMSSIEPNSQFCAVMQGYGVSPAVLLFPAGTGLIGYCQGATAIAPNSVIKIFRGSEVAAHMCRTAPSEILSMTQGSIWAFRAPVPTGPAATYATRALAAAITVCPSLFVD
jgi:Dolichyl-phosphate-mannose-protein mannosyltransferase